MNLQRSWHRFLREVELTRNYHPIIAATIGSPCAPNPILDGILSTLLYIQSMNLFDDALAGHIDQQRLALPKRYTASLGGRIRFLGDSGRLLDPSALLEARDRRNAFSHEDGTAATWEELDATVHLLHTELEHLDIVGPRPAYEFFSRVSAVRPSGLPGVDYEQTHTCGLQHQGRMLIGYRAFHGVKNATPPTRPHEEEHVVPSSTDKHGAWKTEARHQQPPGVIPSELRRPHRRSATPRESRRGPRTRANGSGTPAEPKCNDADPADF
jgi:hypothetical protein